MLTSLCSTLLSPRNNLSCLEHIIWLWPNTESGTFSNPPFLSRACLLPPGILHRVVPITQQSSPVSHTCKHSARFTCANSNPEHRNLFPTGTQKTRLVFSSLWPPRRYRAVLNVPGSSTAHDQGAGNGVHCSYCTCRLPELCWLHQEESQPHVLRVTADTGSEHESYTTAGGLMKSN